MEQSSSSSSNKEILLELEGLGACRNARDWFWENGFSSMQEAWEVCHRAPWMCWLLARTDHPMTKTVVLNCIIHAIRSCEIFDTPTSWTYDVVLDVLKKGAEEATEFKDAYQFLGLVYWPDPKEFANSINDAIVGLSRGLYSHGYPYSHKQLADVVRKVVPVAPTNI